MILNDIENSGGVAPDGRPDGEAKNATASVPKKKKTRFGKKSILIFLSGLLAGAVLFTAVFAAAGSGFFSGMFVRSSAKADAIINAISSEKLVVVFTHGSDSSLREDFERAYDELREKYKDTVQFYKFDAINDSYMDLVYFSDYNFLCYCNGLSFFVDGRMRIYMQNGYNTGDDFVRAVDRYFMPEAPVPDPAVYEMFLGDSGLNRPLDYDEYDVIGEIKLFTSGSVRENYQKCDGRTLTGFRYSILAKQYGSWSKDDVRVALPDLDGGLSSSGIEYYMCTNAGLAAEATAAQGEAYNGINYIKRENADIGQYYVGEIKLADKASIVVNNGYLLPCDGSELNIVDYKELYAKIGTSFGGDGTKTFKLPDLSGKSPIDGAEYYICYKGIAS